MPQVAWEALLLLLLIMFNGIFALSEIAIVSARKMRLEQMAAAGDHGARNALRLLEDPNRFLSTVQVGITLVGTVAGVFGGARFAEPLAGLLSDAGIPPEWSHNIAIALVVILITYLSLTIGELVPKRVALHNPERIATLMAGPMRALAKISSPVVTLLSVSTEALVRLLPLKPNPHEEVTEEDIRSVIRQGAQVGVLRPEEQEMLDRLLRLDDRRVSVLMTPRREIVYFERRARREEIMQTVEEHRYSRYPVCGDGIDEILGIVHLRDLMKAMQAEEIDLTQIMTQPLHILDTTRALSLLRQFKNSGIHIAIVQDEFGGVQGMVTLNDIFESIVGSLPEVGEPEEPDVVRREDGSWLVNGSTPIDELRAVVPECETVFEPGAGYETLGGFVMTQMGKIPAAGETFLCAGIRFEVVDMDERRVDKVLISPPAPPESAKEPVEK